MANELTVIKPRIVTMEVNGHKLRTVEGIDMTLISDIANAVGIGHAAEWIKRLNVVSNDHKLNVVSNDVKVEYYDINEANPAAFTNTAGVIEILGGSRKPIAKVLLQALIGKLRERTVAPVVSQDGFIEALDRNTAMVGKVLDKVISLESRVSAIESNQSWHQEMVVKTTTTVQTKQREKRTGPAATRAEIVSRVEHWAQGFLHATYDVAWRILYHNYQELYITDFVAIQRNRNLKQTIDAVQEEGLLEHFLEFVKEYIRNWKG